jgi:hypothetical protein
MATVKEQMQAIKHLIQTKQYRKARKALKKVDHPTARKWEAQLDTIAPESKRPSVGAIIGYVVFALVGLVGVLALLGYAWSTTDGYQDMMGRPYLTGYCSLVHESAADIEACNATVAALDTVVVADCNRDTNLDDAIDQMYAMAICVERATGVEF